jgi:hypothetical protein
MMGSQAGFRVLGSLEPAPTFTAVTKTKPPAVTPISTRLAG